MYRGLFSKSSGFQRAETPYSGIFVCQLHLGSALSGSVHLRTNQKSTILNYVLLPWLGVGTHRSACSCPATMQGCLRLVSKGKCRICRASWTRRHQDGGNGLFVGGRVASQRAFLDRQTFAAAYILDSKNTPLAWMHFVLAVPAGCVSAQIEPSAASHKLFRKEAPCHA